jgi:ABC-type transporter Mla subunit MlaD
MDDLSKKLAAQLDVLARTVLALEAYLSQTRAVVADTKKLIEEVRAGRALPPDERGAKNGD